MPEKIACPNNFSISNFPVKDGCGGFPSVQICQDCNYFVGRKIDLNSLPPLELRELQIADYDAD
ncbi:hypothetical protein KKD37_00585 [Patescibacteria group bacterium]|nr:hypothetical protein [Patescibacteria group bacterium]